MMHGFLTAALTLALVALAPRADAQVSSPLAPVEIHADGFTDVRGVVVDGAGNVFVADREAGTVTRIAPDHTRTIVAAALERPIGLAVDPVGRLLIAEERAGRVVRVEPNGGRTAIVGNVKQPRWLAVRDDGTLYVAARRLARGTDPEPDDESAEPEVILRLALDGTLTVVADGFRKLQALAVDHQALFAATQGRHKEVRSDGVVFRVPLLPDGSPAGPPVPFGATDEFKKPVGLARDRLGALYVATKELTLVDDHSKRAIGKLHPDTHVTAFAERLQKPQGLAFDPDGNLYVADGAAGRVLKFRAPAPPTVASPPFTSQSPFTVTGSTVAAARVDVFVADAQTAVTIVADAAGAFSVPVALRLDAVNALEIFATSHGGHGLTSAATETTITHDDIPPALVFQAPPAGASIRGTVMIQARASDAGSQIASLSLTVDAQPLASALAPPPPGPSVAATATWPTLIVPDGVHTLSASAQDRAGNTRSASRIVLVDNTPPDTEITGGPSGDIQDTSATLTFTGTDNLTAVTDLQFAWRLDDGPWSPFDGTTTATLTALSVGPHRFEVTARDLAGNEDPTPAQRTFAVNPLRVVITDPADGASVPAGVLLVRGTVQAGGVEVGVKVDGVPAAVQGTNFAALVPVDVTTTMVTALATTATGATATHTVALTVVAAGPASLLLASPPAGTAPLTVSFSLSGGPAPMKVDVDFDGDGIADFSGSTLDGRAFTYARPGLYVATAMVTDGGGHSTRGSAVVHVFDGATLDALLQAKWSGMKNALRTGDIQAALGFITPGARAGYEQALLTIAARLPAVDAILPDVAPVEMRKATATYDATRVDAGVPKLFEVRFVIDADGIWRLQSF